MLFFLSPIALLVLWDSSVYSFSSLFVTSLSAAALLTTSPCLSLNFSSSHQSLFHSRSSLEMQMSWNLGCSPGLLHLFNDKSLVPSPSLAPPLPRSAPPFLFLSSPSHVEMGEKKDALLIGSGAVCGFSNMLLFSLRVRLTHFPVPVRTYASAPPVDHLIMWPCCNLNHCVQGLISRVCTCVRFLFLFISSCSPL